MTVNTVSDADAKHFGPTEHIIQLAISIDDGKIIAGVEEAAKTQILSELTASIKKAIFERRWDGEPTSEPREWCKQEYSKFLEAHSQEIVESAAKALAEKLARPKVGKELLGKAGEK